MAKKGKTPADETADIREKLTKVKAIEPPDYGGGLSTGSTLINLACTGRPDVGFVPGGLYFFVGDSNSGKAQPLDSKVLTPTGWREMGSLLVGDRVIDPDGGNSVVLGVYPQGVKPVYRVTMSDGTSTRCCAEHLWLVTTGNDLRRGTTRIKRTTQLAESISRGEALYIPRNTAVYFDEQGSLPVDPYVLGCLLGNGHIRDGMIRFSSDEKEIVDRVVSRLPEGNGLELSSPPRDYRVSARGKGKPSPLSVKMKEMGLVGRLAHDKFIPPQYLTASVEDRLELLRGLMDTDGTVGKQGQLEYNTTSRALAEGVRQLVFSLGGNTTLGVRKAPKYTYKGEQRTGRDCYGVRIRTPGIMPFRLSRKVARVREDEKRDNRKRVVSVEADGEEKCQCIAVSSRRCLYITDGYIVTHNTFFSLASMAEASQNPKYDDYSFIYDGGEYGAQMSLAKLFGKKMAERVRPPAYRNGMPAPSEQIEDFYYNLDNALDKGPVIYVQDSMDVLSSSDEEKKFLEMKKERGGGKEAAGSYGDGKAKKNSQYIRQMLPKIHATKSIVVIIAQTRDNIGAGPFSFEKQTRAGGHALTFYAQVELWSSIKKQLTKDVKLSGGHSEARRRHIGNLCEISVERSRYTGHKAKVTVPIYYRTGIDEVGSCVDYLIDEGYWKKNKGNVDAPEFDHAGTVEKLIRKIEDEGREKELRSLVAQVWCEISEASGVERKRRYV